MLHLEFEGSGQGFGGWDLRHYGIEFLMRIMETLGVSVWEQLPGTYCRVIGTNSKLTGIGHITKDRWYYPEQEDNNGT